MEKSNILLSLIALAFLFACFSMVSATLIQPGTGSTIGGTATLTATNATTLVNMTNCTFYAQSASTANSSWATLAFASNLTQNPINISTTFNSNTLEDANDYIFNATCLNLTLGTSSLTTGVTIDNTVPSAPTSTSPVTSTINGTVGGKDFAATVTNSQTIACNFIIAKNSPGLDNPSAYGYSAASGTYSGSNCTGTRTFTRNEIGRWYWRMQASDGTNFTNSSINLLTIENIDDGGSPQAPPQRGFGGISNFFKRFMDGIRRMFQ